MAFGEQVTVALIRNIASEKYVIPESKGGIFFKGDTEIFFLLLWSSIGKEKRFGKPSSKRWQYLKSDHSQKWFEVRAFRNIAIIVMPGCISNMAEDCLTL